jgi:hypothetical protein
MRMIEKMRTENVSRNGITVHKKPALHFCKAGSVLVFHSPVQRTEHSLRPN